MSASALGTFDFIKGLRLVRYVCSRMCCSFVVTPVVVTSNDPGDDGQSMSSSSAS